MRRFLVLDCGFASSPKAGKQTYVTRLLERFYKQAIYLLIFRIS